MNIEGGETKRHILVGKIELAEVECSIHSLN